MNKKGLIGKILLGVLIIVIIVFIIIGVTVYQATKVVQVVREETVNIQKNSELLAEEKDCTHIEYINTSIERIETSVSGACRNLILKFAISKAESVPVKCETLPALKKDFENRFSEAKLYCEDPDKMNEMITNGSLSRTELVALAKKYGIKI